jgi:peptidoglycan/LPS O-acetylase OafA/YrhL
MFLQPQLPAPAMLERVGAPAFWVGLFGMTVFNGRAAVSLFFVLSGFVISLGIDTSRNLDAGTYVAFLTRRFFRLLPPLWAAIVFSFIIQVHRGATYDLPSVLNFLFLADLSINPVEWSLVLEIAVCMIYPLLLFALRRLSVSAQALVLVAVAAMQLRDPIQLHYGETVAPLPLYCFCLGIVVPTLGRMIIEGPLARISAPLAASALVAIGLSAPIAAFAEFYPTPLAQRVSVIWNILTVPTAAFYLISWLVYADRPISILKNSAALFLGKTSYSIYILHGPIMAATWEIVTSFSSPRERLFVGLLVVIPPTLILSYINYHYVERPSIKLGKWIMSAVTTSFSSQSSVPEKRRTQSEAGVPVTHRVP